MSSARAVRAWFKNWGNTVLVVCAALGVAYPVVSFMLEFRKLGLQAAASNAQQANAALQLAIVERDRSREAQQAARELAEINSAARRSEIQLQKAKELELERLALAAAHATQQTAESNAAAARLSLEEHSRQRALELAAEASEREKSRTAEDTANVQALVASLFKREGYDAGRLLGCLQDADGSTGSTQLDVDGQKELQHQCLQAFGPVESSRNDSSAARNGRLGTLATLAPYAVPRGRQIGGITAALSVALTRPDSATEVEMIFTLLERIGPEAMSVVVDANRAALKDFVKTNIATFWTLVSSKTSEEIELRYRPVPDADESAKEIISGIVSRNAFEPEAEALIRGLLSKEWASAVEMYKRDNDEDEVTALSDLEEISDVKAEAAAHVADLGPETMPITATVLQRSKITIAKLLPSSEGSVQLSGTYLGGVKLAKGMYPFVSFAGAYIEGADFSTAELDRDSLLTLSDSYLVAAPSAVQKVSSSDTFPQGVRLSASQKAVVSSARGK